MITIQNHSAFLPAIIYMPNVNCDSFKNLSLVVTTSLSFDNVYDYLFESLFACTYYAKKIEAFILSALHISEKYV